MYQIVYLKYRENGYPSEMFLERNNVPREDLERLLLSEGYIPFYNNTDVITHSEAYYYYNFKMNVEAWIFPNEKNFKRWRGVKINCPILDAWKD